MPEPTLQEHEDAFRAWLQQQGDLSAQSNYNHAHAAFFAGASYGLDMAMATYADLKAQAD